MIVYKNDQWDQPANASVSNNIEIPLGEYLNMAVVLDDHKDGVKLVVQECFATPDSVIKVTKKSLFENK